MMIDNALAVSNAQVITVTGNSTDYIDALGSLNVAGGQLETLRFVLNVSAVSGTSPTMTVNLVGADDSGFSTNKVTIGGISTNITAVGNYRIPTANVGRKRYYRLEYTIGGTTPSFTVTLCVVADDEARQTP
jgi:hypothetical protein